MVMRAVLLVALAACRVAELDYTGKQCPCPDGWQCDLATNTCTQDPTIDAGGDGPRPDDASPSDSCFNGPRNVLIYSSVGFPDFPQGWMQGIGSWSRTQGELQQTNSANELAWLQHSVATTGGVPNYRVVATLRALGGFDTGSAGITFRTAGITGSMYSCSFNPKTGVFSLIVTENLIDRTLDMRALAPPNDSTAPFTMEVNANGTNHSCCLRGYDDSLLYALDGTLQSGAPGIITRKAEAGFLSFYAYE